MSGGYQNNSRGADNSNYNTRSREQNWHQNNVGQNDLSGIQGGHGVVLYDQQYYQTQPPPSNAWYNPLTACQGQHGFNPLIPSMHPGIAAGVGRGILQGQYTNPSIPGTTQEQYSTTSRQDARETDKGTSGSGNRSRSRSNEGIRQRSSSNQGGGSRSHSYERDSQRTHSKERREPRVESGGHAQNSYGQGYDRPMRGDSQSWSRGRGKNQNHHRQNRGQGNHWPGMNQGSYQGYYQDNYHQYDSQQNYNQNSDWGHSGRQQYRASKREQDDLVFLSKTLSSVLRHNAERFGLKLMKGGFIYVDEIFQKVHKLRGFDMDSIQWVVDNNDKKRFTLEKEEGSERWKIRANQGHSLEVDDLDLKPITSADEFPHVIHGTYYTSWKMIKETGLCRMNRNHIHFAAGEPGHDGVISGMRSSCEVMIYIDLEKALKDGLKFFVSSNNVILCPGNEDGYVFPCYFTGALDRRLKHRLPFDDKICSLKHPAGSEAGSSQNKKGKKGGKNRNKEEFDNTTQRNPKDRQREITAEQNDDFELPDACKEPEKVKDAPKTPTQPPTDKVQPKRQQSAERKKEEPPLKKEEPPVKKDGPEWLESPTVLTDNETSASAVDHILTELSPSSIVICCCGRGLGTESSDLAVMVVMAQPEIYVYHLQEGQKNVVTDGRLIDLLLSKDIKKVFHNIGSVSASLIQEFDILLNGVPICDIALMWAKCTPSQLEKDALVEKFGVQMPEIVKRMKSWEIENEELVEKLKDKDKTQEVVDKLIQRGKLIAEMYRICSSRLNQDLEKKLKTEIYALAIPNEGFLTEKIAQLKQAAKDKGKKDPAKATEQASAKPPPQQQQNKQKQHQQKQSPNKQKNKRKK